MILHADVDAFFASVAQRNDPALRGRPVICGSWVVMAASYEARAYGVRSGTSTAVARRLCPDAVVVPASWEANVAASRALFAIFERFTARVEPGSMEEAFLDVSAAAEPSAELAARLRREVREEAGLPLSVGVARTKVLAKMASRSAKPDGLHVVAPDAEEAFLHPLPVERIWGVGPATARRLHAHGLRTVGQAAALDEPALMAVLGKAAGRYVHAVAHNREPRPLQQRRSRRSFGAQRALGRAPRTREELDAAVEDLAGRIARRMEGKGRAGRTVVLRLRFGDYARATRSTTLTCATAEAAAVAAAARELLDAAMPLVERRGITLVGLTVTNLDVVADGTEQLALFAGNAGAPGVESRAMASPAAQLPDIETRADCERLVRAFYERTLTDPIIGWIFTDVAGLDLEAHLPVVASFWETVLLGGQSYRGGTFAPHAAIHARIGLREGHFERWLSLWRTAVDERFAGERAEAAKAHAERVARAFLGRLRTLPSGAAPATGVEAPSGLTVTIHRPAPTRGGADRQSATEDAAG